HEVSVEVPLGNYVRPVHRNTKWDRAKFEVWYSRWIDLSEYNYGVSIISLSPIHGFDVFFNKIGLTLLKSPISPTPLLSSEKMNITYVLYPHRYTWREAQTHRIAYQLDEKPIVIPFAGSGNYTKRSFLTIDSPAVVVESIKPCEDHDNCIVIRAIESLNSRQIVSIDIDSDDIQCFESDVLEEHINAIDCKNIVFKPYEIKTLIIKRGTLSRY
ncbi:MAG TPA: hypothetical protein ENG44_02365, partial [Desulfurococcaceae archaeon]|nr:hypothetical protein [Desulfurococcaceae archaeon]